MPKSAACRSGVQEAVQPTCGWGAVGGRSHPLDPRPLPGWLFVQAVLGLWSHLGEIGQVFLLKNTHCYTLLHLPPPPFFTEACQ